MPTVLITGTSRGIGLELTRQYAGRGWNVIATARNLATSAELSGLAATYPNIRMEQLDVTDGESVRSLAQRLDNEPIDILLHNAGVAPGSSDQSTFGTLDFSVGDLAIATNVWGVLAATEALLPNVQLGKLRKVMVVSSFAGSISSIAGTEPSPWGDYIYRISKTALNMTMSLVARDLKPRGIIVGMLSPGLVDTELGGGHVGIPRDLIITPSQSAGALIPVIDGYTLDTSGKFMRYTGAEVPW